MAYRAALAGSWGWFALDRAGCHPLARRGTRAPIHAPGAPDDRLPSRLHPRRCWGRRLSLCRPSRTRAWICAQTGAARGSD